MFVVEEFDRSADLSYFFSYDVSENTIGASVTPYSFEFLSPVDSFMGLRAAPLAQFEEAGVSAIQESTALVSETNLLDADLNLDFLNTIFPTSGSFALSIDYPTPDSLDGFMEPVFDLSLFELTGAADTASEIASVETDTVATVLDVELMVEGVRELPSVTIHVEETMFGVQTRTFEIDGFGL